MKMFYKHVVVFDNNQEVLYLYMNNTYEFSNDLESKNSSDSIYQRIINYINMHGVKFDGSKIYLVVDKRVVASLTLNNAGYNNEKNYDFISYLKDNVLEDIEILDVDDYPSIKLVDLNRSSGIIERMKLEDYVFGIVGGEMPGVFNIEAMKAQAVIARTYAMRQIKKRKDLKDYNETQIFRDHHYLKLLWADKYDSYKEKVKLAIDSTKGQVLKYDGELIDAYYHLTNNGKTENSKNVLKLSYPYLVSVSSVWDLSSPNYLNKRRVSNDYLSKLLNMKIDSSTMVEILSRTEGSRVKYIKFNDKVFDGFILGSKLGLPSNDYSVEVHDDETLFTVRGFGHGLGLSKYGANGMAKQGYNYKQILEHYFPNTYIDRETS